MPTTTQAPRDDIHRLAVSFQHHLRATNRAPRTIEKYLMAVKQFAAFTEANDGPTAVSDIRKRDVEAYIAHLLDRFKPGTAVTRYQDLRVFFGWLVEGNRRVTDGENEAAAPPRRPRPGAD